jgi:hypothetical protein
VYIEQARTEAGILMPPLDNIDSDMYKELNQEELEEVTKGHGRDANAKLRVALQQVGFHSALSLHMAYACGDETRHAIRLSSCPASMMQCFMQGCTSRGVCLLFVGSHPPQS